MTEAKRAAEIAANHAAKRFADRLQRINRRAGQYRSPGAMLPILNADPDPSSSTNMWALADGRLRFRLPDGTVKELATVTAGSPTSSVTLPADPSPQRYEKTYAATWAREYCTMHGVETGAQLGYGTDQGQHGNRQVLVGFDQLAIAGDLAGSVIQYVELSMLNTDSWDPAGVDVSFGAHNQATAAAAFLATRRGVFTASWPAVGAGQEWRKAPDWYGRAFRDGLAAGISIDQPPGLPFSGELNWASLRLRIGYTK